MAKLEVISKLGGFEFTTKCKDCKWFEDLRFQKECHACKAWDYINYEGKK